MAGKVKNSSLMLLVNLAQTDKKVLRKPPQVIYKTLVINYKL